MIAHTACFPQPHASTLDNRCGSFSAHVASQGGTITRFVRKNMLCDNHRCLTHLFTVGSVGPFIVGYHTFYNLQSSRVLP